MNKKQAKKEHHKEKRIADSLYTWIIIAVILIGLVLLSIGTTPPMAVKDSPASSEEIP